MLFTVFIVDLLVLQYIWCVELCVQTAAKGWQVQVTAMTLFTKKETPCCFEFNAEFTRRSELFRIHHSRVTKSVKFLLTQQLLKSRHLLKESGETSAITKIQTSFLKECGHMCPWTPPNVIWVFGSQLHPQCISGLFVPVPTAVQFGSLRTDGDTTCDKNKEQQRIDWFQRYLTQILSCHAETEEQLRRQGLNSPCRWAPQDLPRSILKGWAIPSLAKSWGKRRWDGFISSLSSLLMRARRSYSFVIPLHLM